MKYNEESFVEGVNKAYRILWDMFKPDEGCNWDTEKEQKLLNMINKIDNEMGR